MVPRCRLAADYGCDPVWERGADGSFVNSRLDSLVLPPALVEALRRWSETYEATLDMSDPASSGFGSRVDLVEFVDAGRLLARELAGVLGEPVLFFDDLLGRDVVVGAVGGEVEWGVESGRVERLGSELVWTSELAERRLSLDHIRLLGRWVNQRKIEGGTPPGLVILRRFLRQLCGAALQGWGTDQLDLAVRTAFVCGAWVGDQRGDTEWLNLSFVAFCARELGLDPVEYLVTATERLELERRDWVSAAASRLAVIEDPVDDQRDRYAAILRNGSVDFEGRWRLARHEEREAADLRRAGMARRAGSDNRSSGKVRPVVALPWLPPDVEPFEYWLGYGKGYDELSAWVRERRWSEPPAVPLESVAEFVCEQASRGARSGDAAAIEAALVVAAQIRPELLGLPFRAAQHVFGDEADRWLGMKSGGDMVEIGKRLALPERFEIPGEYVETGLVGGLRFFPRYRQVRLTS